MLRGISVSEGIGIGNVYVVQDSDFADVNGTAVYSSHTNTDFTAEKARLDHAIQVFLKNTEEMADNLKKNMATGTDETDILLSHTLIVKDEDFQKQVEELLKQGKNCEEAVVSVANQYRQLFLQSGDEELMLRATDIADIQRRLIAILTDTNLPDFASLSQDTVLIIRELLPSQVPDIVKGRITAVITEKGGYNSHAAILARTAGIPMISGIAYDETATMLDGKKVIIDAYDAVILLAEDENVVKTYKDKQNAKKAEKEALEELTDKVTATKDGRRIKLYANIADTADITEAVRVNADGVGLFRTEHIFMSQSCVPDEETQYKKYCNVAKAFKDKPVVIRTLDIGGDKQIPYISSEQEPNPFLGHRAIRFCLDNPEIFKTQLRALIKAHNECSNIRILIPFITCVDEIKYLKNLIREIAGNNSNIKIGIMIETPAAVFLAGQLAKYVDFFSIGTNDLSQYIMAADRGNDKVVRLCSHYQPAVLRAIAMTMTEANAMECEVELCGEAAADTALIPVLIGIGIKNFSVSATSILKVRKAIAECDYTEAIDIARHVLSLETASEVEAYLEI